MKTIEQTRRELFEAIASRKWPYCGQNKRDALPHSDARYMEYVHLETEWQAFNAALDAVVIELPLGAPNYMSNDEESCFLSGVEACRSAVESTNLGLKII